MLPIHVVPSECQERFEIRWYNPAPRRPEAALRVASVDCVPTAPIRLGCGGSMAAELELDDMMPLDVGAAAEGDSQADPPNSPVLSRAKSEWGVSEISPRSKLDDLTPRKGGIMKCAVCLQSEGDIDLGDAAGEATTPFRAFSGRAGKNILCDHCDGMLRYHMETEGRSVSAHVALQDADPELRKTCIDRLSCILALRSTPALEDRNPRIAKMTVDKHMGFLDRFSKIHMALQAKRGASAADLGISDECNIVGLPEYVQNFGNPIVNGDKLFSCLIAGSVQLAVATKKVLPPARLTLAGIVQSTAGRNADEDPHHQTRRLHQPEGSAGALDGELGSGSLELEGRRQRIRRPMRRRFELDGCAASSTNHSGALRPRKGLQELSPIRVLDVRRRKCPTPEVGLRRVRLGVDEGGG